MLPLPYHAKNAYTERPGALENEWTYQQHTEDWQKFHTRYVTPEVFKNALRARSDSGEPGPGVKSRNEREPGSRIVVGIFFVGLLVTPLVIKRISAKHAADRASADSATALARHGFYLQEVSHSAGINLVHQAPAWIRSSNPSCPRSRPWELQSRSWTSTVTAGLYYVVNSAIGSKNALYRNMGDGTFKDVAGDLGIADVNQTGTGVSTGAVWGAFDNDGYEDLFMKWGAESSITTTRAAVPPASGPSRIPHWMNADTAISLTTTVTDSWICSSVATTPKTSTCGI